MSLITINTPPHIKSLLERLHALSEAQEEQIRGKVQQLVEHVRRDERAGHAALDELMRDKFVALEPDKAAFVYQLILATGATRIVKAGTSFGVSTIYLALAVGQNSIDGRVIATEKESSKAAQARQHWAEAGPAVEKHIELREGDLLKTLQDDELRDIDFVLLDIWTPLVLPLLQLLHPKLRPGAVLVADNTISSAVGYSDMSQYINQSRDFQTLTLPYTNGLELIVYKPQSNSRPLDTAAV